jgi:hypothetical protein
LAQAFHVMIFAEIRQGYIIANPREDVDKQVQVA